MSAWSDLSRFLSSRSSDRSARALHRDRAPRIAAYVLVAACVFLGVLAHASTLRPGNLGLTLARVDGGLQVSWVMPAGQAWHDGVRPGMRVVSLNGSPTDPLPSVPLSEAEVVGRDGRVLRTRVVTGPIVRAPWKWSLWILGAMFALSGSAVAVRRPDLGAARRFLLFCAFAAIALVVSPSAGGPHTRWALMIMFPSLIGVGATLLPFVLTLLGDDAKHRLRDAARVHVGIGVVLAGWYVVSVAAFPRIYSGLRISFAIYVMFSILTSIAVLGSLAARHRLSPQGQQARVILFGVLLGTLPFVTLSLVPEILWRGAVVPTHLAVLPAAFIPAATALAVVQSQFLGIRRLIHRGMVYSLTTTVLFIAVVLLAYALTPMLRLQSTPQGTSLFIGLLVAACVGLFYPLRLGIRRLVDRFLYADAVDPARLIEVFRDDVIASTRADDLETWIDRIARTLHVESALLFAGASSGQSRLLAAVGPRAPEILEAVGHEILGKAEHAGETDLVELQWGAESLLIGVLRVAERGVGRLVLGPKEGGEVFVPVEQQLVAAVAPVLALALHKTDLSDQLRVLNERLVDGEEAERARLASDVHDGPLQKAILLGGLFDSPADRQGLARELASDLREVCSRLRPAILDDLGLVPALEWLLEDAARRFKIAPRLELSNVSDADRFAMHTELALFRVTQEAINNAVKHGKPSIIDVSLISHHQGLLLRVDDNGVGFAADVNHSVGFGISGIRGRVGRLGGSVDIRSTPGQGTSVLVRVPHAQGTV